MSQLGGAPFLLRRSRLEKAVFQSQLPLAAAMLIFVFAVFVFEPDAVVEPWVFSGVAAIFIVTVLAVAVSWGRFPRAWIAVIPVCDMIAIAITRQGNLHLDAGVLLIFPVIWLSSYFSFFAAFASCSGAIALLWGSTFLRGAPLDLSSAPSLFELPVTLIFVATVTYLTSKRAAAQRSLLRQQAELLDSAHQRARRHEQILDEVLNAVSFAVVACDKAGNQTLLNRAHRQMMADFGLPQNQLVHPKAYGVDRTTPILQHELPDHRARMAENFDDLIMWLGEPGGYRRALSVSVRQLFSASGERDGWVMVSRDVTTEINAIQARDDLVASVSHELRTPLTSILGYLELALEHESLQESTRSMLQIAFSNAERLLVLVSDLLGAVSDADEQLVMSFQPCDLSALALEAVADHRRAAREQGITVECEHGTPIFVLADAVRLRQVVDNLLTNSLKYNKEGGSVSVSVRKNGTEAHLQVTDTGIGLSELDQKQLFDRYFRAEAARQSTITGSGLGLSISRDIVHRHGGELSVSSVPGVGSTFTVSLPLATPQTEIGEK